LHSDHCLSERDDDDDEWNNRNKNEDYETQLQTLLESAAAQEESIDLNDYVSKAKVKEMETLFIDTVTKLSGRVNALEGRSVSMEGRSSSGMDSSYSNAAVGSKSSQGSYEKHVRLEPGGRIRCAPTSNNNSNGTTSNNSHSDPNGTLVLQQSHSADTIILRSHEDTAKGKGGPSMVSSGVYPIQQQKLQQQRDKLW